jgi:hypothetical protein
MLWNMLSRLGRILVEPSARLTDAAQRYESHLLNIFLLFFIVVFACMDVFYFLTKFGYILPWYGFLFLLESYILNKLGKYAVSSSLTMAMFPIVIFSLPILFPLRQPVDNPVLPDSWPDFWKHPAVHSWMGRESGSPWLGGLSNSAQAEFGWRAKRGKAAHSSLACLSQIVILLQNLIDKCPDG